MTTRHKQKTKAKSKRHGGAATNFPLKYFDAAYKGPSAAPGHDLLQAIPPQGIRPRIGGRRGSKRALRKKQKTIRKRQKGGFVPSVMGNFIAAASTYIAPLALFAGYKLLTKKQAKHAKRT